jgi:hypothetical protein
MMRTILIVVCLLLSTAPASAECAWVWWSRMEMGKDRFDWAPGAVFPNYAACRTAIGKVMYLDEPGSVRDWWLWLTRQGPYDPKRPRAGSAEFVGAIWTDDGAVSLGGPNQSVEVRCLPETMDPSGPKREAR